MAVIEFDYSYTNDQLSDILNLAISLIVGDDLRNFEILPQLSLHYILNERGFGHGAGFEIDAYPPQKSLPLSFYVIQGDIFGYSKSGRDVAVFSPDEIKKAIRMELARQVDREPSYAIHAKNIAERFELGEQL